MTVTGQGDVTGVDDAAAAFLVRGMENKRKMKPEEHRERYAAEHPESVNTAA